MSPALEEPRAQTGLRSGKLATHLARNADGLPDYRFFRINISGLPAHCGNWAGAAHDHP